MPTFDPSRKDFSPYGFTCVRWTPAVAPRPDRHNEIELNLLEEGSLTYLLGGSKVTVPAGRLAIFWAGMPHQTIGFDCPKDYFVLTIPLAWFLQWRLPMPFVHKLLCGQILFEPDAGRMAMDRIQFQSWVEDLATNSDERRWIVLLEVEARMRRLALAVPAETLATAPGRASAVLEGGSLRRAEQMAILIAQRYAEPLTVEHISRMVGLHPNYAMAVFRRVFGTTLVDYITQHRLAHAQRLLVTTDELILTVALQAGFGSLSRFNEAFRRAFGCTPREYRRHHRVT